MCHKVGKTLLKGGGLSIGGITLASAFNPFPLDSSYMFPSVSGYITDKNGSPGLAA
jgi:hypothetical protein